MEYHFLILSLLFAIPGAIIYLCRRDLRIVIRRLMLCSIPFAFTEFLFYPDYWEPKFLFDLAAKIGFGIEDFIFVMGLAAFSGTGYAMVYRQTFQSEKTVTFKQIAFRISMLSLIAAASMVIQTALSIPIIYGAIITMVAISLGVILVRLDLLVPSVLGGVISVGIYLTLCRIILLFIPELFETNWKLDAYSAMYILGVPLEELLYGFAAGCLACIFYPFVFSCRYVTHKDIL